MGLFDRATLELQRGGHFSTELILNRNGLSFVSCQVLATDFHHYQFYLLLLVDASALPSCLLHIQ